MTEDEVLSGAIEVFNSSVQTGTSTAGTTGQQNTPGVFDNTATGTRQTEGTASTGTQNQTSTGKTGTGTVITGSTANLPAGNGDQTGVPVRRVIVLDDGSGTKTGQERVETLDRELDNSMGVFDGVILSRRQEVIARTNETGAGQTGTSVSGTGSVNESNSNTPPLLTGGNGNNTGTDGQLPDAQSDNRQGDYASTGTGNANIPADISDGTDDDIVARQLREAAMQEKDPALREKLWDEYRKYKQGVQTKK